MSNKKTKLEGFRELEATLADLPNATGKNVLTRVLKAAAEPIARYARAKARRLTGVLRRSIIVGKRLTKRQASLARKAKKSEVEVHVGTADPAGVPLEFGTFRSRASPFMRPAWDAMQRLALKIIVRMLGQEIEKATKRYARKVAKIAAKNRKK